ncbi:MAG: nitrophenyl compound nitroreductase subunit ArsF family protein [Planctomycetota bacterium]|nr:nitrophenyl compound nitroreductase subunit ArsF family protein [Planctomycetota bacterium]
MKHIRFVLRWGLLLYVAVAGGYLAWSEVSPNPAVTHSPEASPESSRTAVKLAPNRLEVTYFTFGKRCSACRLIEKYTRARPLTVLSKRSEPRGSLAFAMVNCDEEGNKHFLEKFSLSSKSVLILKYENGELVDWENMTHVWTLTNNEEDFLLYIRDMVRMMLEEFEGGE